VTARTKSSRSARPKTASAAASSKSPPKSRAGKSRTSSAESRAAQQRARLRLGEHDGLATTADAAKFLADVGIALRYGPSDKLPLASMYQAVWRLAGKRPESEDEAQRRAGILTNALIDGGLAIEVTAVADRVAVMAPSVAPAMYVLVRRVSRDILDLSDDAREVLAFIENAERPTAGQVRAYLGVPPKTWPNRADDALAELQRRLLIDRGAVQVPATGIPYLPKDGIPYRVFDETHVAIVKAASKLSVDAAAGTVVERYLRGARYAEPRKLASMFKLCMSRAEVDHAVASLVERGVAAMDGTAVVAVD
jgi:hypothetical protein